MSSSQHNLVDYSICKLTKVIGMIFYGNYFYVLKSILMLSKKNPDIEVGRNSSLYFAIGLCLMLVSTYSLLNYKSYEKNEIANTRFTIKTIFTFIFIPSP